MQIRHILAIAVCAASLCWHSASAQLAFTGASQQPINEKPAASTGLADIYIIYDTNGVTASYQAANANVTWMRYSNLGGGYAEEITASRDDNIYTIALDSRDMGYIIEDGTSRYCCWIVNYANHMPVLNALNFADEQDCDRTRMTLDGNASKITYYTINGQGRDLDRGITVRYTTMAYDEGVEDYLTVPAEVVLASIDGTFGLEAPLCDTDFTLIADKFLQQWGMPVEVQSGTFHTQAVQCHASAIQDIRENENEQKVEAGSLGGSAPVDIEFKGAVTEAAIFREWQMSSDPDFENIVDRFQALNFNYSFRDNGTTYVRFVANNAQGTCEYTSDTFEVFVGESALLCPNAFSPGATEGVNDEWRVSYKSLISFECHIFNRWGQQVASFTDPGQGWDGKYNGKLVPPGAYYYVIKAVGSDNKKYNLSGDINIVRSRPNTMHGDAGE